MLRVASSWQSIPHRSLKCDQKFYKTHCLACASMLSASVGVCPCVCVSDNACVWNVWRVLVLQSGILFYSRLSHSHSRSLLEVITKYRGLVVRLLSLSTYSYSFLIGDLFGFVSFCRICVCIAIRWSSACVHFVRNEYLPAVMRYDKAIPTNMTNTYSHSAQVYYIVSLRNDVRVCVWKDHSNGNERWS